MALRAVMRRWGLSQSALARAAGLPQPAISNVVRGKSKSMDSDSLEKLLQGLGKIDPLAREAFWGVLRLHRVDLALLEVPDEIIEQVGQPIVYSYEQPEVLRELIDFLKSEGLINEAELLRREAELNRDREVKWPVEYHLANRLVMKRLERENDLENQEK